LCRDEPEEYSLPTCVTGCQQDCHELSATDDDNCEYINVDDLLIRLPSSPSLQVGVHSLQLICGVRVIKLPDVAVILQWVHVNVTLSVLVLTSHLSFRNSS